MAQQGFSADIPHRLPLMPILENRDEVGNKDAKLVNGFMEYEPHTKEHWIYKRPGWKNNSQVAAGTGLGIFNWFDDIYKVVGTTLYKNTVSIGTVDGTSRYFFSGIMGSTPKLFLKNETAGYQWDGTTLTHVTDVNYPAKTVYGCGYLDGTMYVMDESANIWGSKNLNNTLVWDALNKIVAQIETDQGIAITKQLDYIVAFKEWSTEVFYDAGNPTGSPLGRVPGAKVDYGCAAPYSIQEIDGTLLWLATNRSSAINIVSMTKFAAKVVSTKPVERLFDEIDLSGVQSFQVKHDGHAFYGVTAKNNNLTLVYDMRENQWYQWSYTTNGVQNYLPIVGSTYNTALQHFLLHESNGITYGVDDLYFDDDGATITWDLITPNFDAGVRRNKTLWQMEFIADQNPGCVIQVRHNDDDYDPEKWSNWRTVDLGKRRPLLTQCGTFRRRAYQFRLTAPTKLRMKAVELQMDIGTL